MTVGTGYIIAIMDRAEPVNTLAALMTAQTHLVLCNHRCGAVKGKAQYGISHRGIFDMFRAGAVAGLAACRFTPLAVNIRIESHGMSGMRPLSAGGAMTGNTGVGTNKIPLLEYGQAGLLSHAA